MHNEGSIPFQITESFSDELQSVESLISKIVSTTTV